jgi:MscS family membrane protein
VRVVGFGDYSLDAEVVAYILTADHSEFLAIQEDLFLRIMSILDETGVRLAFLTQLGYHATDLPLDTVKREAAEEQVRKWRMEA